jgi:hypothetical protein
VNLLAILLAIFASCLSTYYLVNGLKSGQVEIFSKASTGKIARVSRPGWYWATIAIWLAGMLLGAYYAASWAVALAAA